MLRRAFLGVGVGAFGAAAMGLRRRGSISRAQAGPRLDGAWQLGAPLLEGRSEIAAAEVDGRLYVGGGFHASGSDLASVEMFDPAVGFWQAVAPLPRGLNHLGITGLSGVLYVAGGSVGPTPATSLYAYEPASDRWTTRADMPLRRSAHVLVAVDQRLYVVGGVGDQPGVTLAYDPDRDAWETRQPIPTPREHLSAATAGGWIYVVGGRWADRGNLDAAEAYNPVSDTWTPLPPLPTARGGLTAGALHGRIHALGGEAFGPDRTFVEHEVFDTLLGQWAVAPPMPTARHGLAAVGIQGQLYVIGGGERAGLTTTPLVEVFEPGPWTS